MAAIVTFPDRDPALFQWSVNFLDYILAHTAAVGLTSTQTAAYQAVHDLFGEKLAAVAPTVRNQAAVIAKNESRTNLKNLAKSYAMIIQGQLTVTDEMRLAMGLSVQAQRQPVPAPDTAPALDLIGVVQRTVSVRLHDDAGEGKRRRPAGVKSATLFSYVGANPPEDPSAFKWEGATTKSNVDIVFPESVEVGTKVWISAVWMNERGENGPMATPLGTKILGSIAA